MVARSFNGRSKAMAVIIGCYTEMASRHPGHGIRAFAKAMKDNHNV
jgi:hypothetical protein